MGREAALCRGKQSAGPGRRAVSARGRRAGCKQCSLHRGGFKGSPGRGEREESECAESRRETKIRYTGNMWRYIHEESKTHLAHA